MLHPMLWARALRCLRETFGKQKLRPGQRQAVQTLLARRDLLCILPTGGGKSLCYQLPAMVLPGMTLVISPLLALMHDQVTQLTARGIPAVSVDSRMTPEQMERTLTELGQGKYRLVYVSPERLENERFRQLLREHPPVLAVVDEAHCVLQWGRDFRPAYAQIGPALASLPVRPIVCAFTATADEAMRRELTEQLGLRHPKTVVQPLNRPNLHYHAILTAKPEQWLKRYVAARQGEKGILFCRTRAGTVETARLLRDYGAVAYHAGLPTEERSRIQDDFAAGRIPVLAATSAFGMGVDIPDIRYVIHAALTADVTDYVQQAGRAGRDGQPSACIQLITPGDLERIRREHAGRQDKAAWREERRLLGIFLGGRCLSRALAAAFGGRTMSCGSCSVCLRLRKHQPARLAFLPPLWDARQRDLRYWLLKTTRRRLAQEAHCRPGKVAPLRALRLAAQTGRLEPRDLDPACWERMQSAIDAL